MPSIAPPTGCARAIATVLPPRQRKPRPSRRRIRHLQPRPAGPGSTCPPTVPFRITPSASVGRDQWPLGRFPSFGHGLTIAEHVPQRRCARPVRSRPRGRSHAAAPHPQRGAVGCAGVGPIDGPTRLSLPGSGDRAVTRREDAAPPRASTTSFERFASLTLVPRPDDEAARHTRRRGFRGSPRGPRRGSPSPPESLVSVSGHTLTAPGGRRSPRVGA